MVASGFPTWPSSSSASRVCSQWPPVPGLPWPLEAPAANGVHCPACLWASLFPPFHVHSQCMGAAESTPVGTRQGPPSLPSLDMEVAGMKSGVLPGGGVWAIWECLGEGPALGPLCSPAFFGAPSPEFPTSRSPDGSDGPESGSPPGPGKVAGRLDSCRTRLPAISSHTLTFLGPTTQAYVTHTWKSAQEEIVRHRCGEIFPLRKIPLVLTLLGPQHAVRGWGLRLEKGPPGLQSPLPSASSV